MGTQTGTRMVIPEGLLRAAQEKKLCTFIGSGFSKNINSSIPDANGLNEIVADNIGYDGDILQA